jgi:ribonuclease BN (tRNA processing enzyme)
LDQGVYRLFEDESFVVRAAPMQHTVPCVGFVIEEKTKSGKLKVEVAEKYVEKNKVNILLWFIVDNLFYFYLFF